MLSCKPPGYAGVPGPPSVQVQDWSGWMGQMSSEAHWRKTPALHLGWPPSRNVRAGGPGPAQAAVWHGFCNCQDLLMVVQVSVWQRKDRAHYPKLLKCHSTLACSPQGLVLPSALGASLLGVFPCACFPQLCSAFPCWVMEAKPGVSQKTITEELMFCLGRLLWVS